MKTLSNFRIFLICLVVLGLFASFAQNEYGYGTIHKWCNCLMGLSFLIEFIALVFLKALSGRERAGRMIEAFALFLFFMGMFAKANRWPGAGISIMVGGGITFLCYLTNGLIYISTRRNTGVKASLLTMLIYFVAASGYLAMTFKQQHWPFAGILLMVTGILTGLSFLLSFVFRKVMVDGRRITVFRLAERTSIRLGFSFIFISIWSLYLWFNLMSIAPPLFTLQNPPAYSRLIDEMQKPGKTPEEREELERKANELFLKHEQFIIKRHEESGGK